MAAVENDCILIEDEEEGGVDNKEDKVNVDNLDNLDNDDDDTDDVKEVKEEDTSNVKNQPAPRPKGKKKNFRFINERYDRYNNAYGDYNGGYGPPNMGYQRNYSQAPHDFGPQRDYGPQHDFGPQCDFGPPRDYGPQSNFGPQPLMFSMGPQGPQGNAPYTWGRGFGPDGPPIRRQPMDDKTIRYLTRCGVGKEHLKNLPRALLQLIEPEYCGLCAFSLESFAISRMHYLSKNHLKNQKKWLNQQSELGFRRVKEISLKARELYCELCDVHITSKSHSEAHYAGKPHRAIVDGRKQPKNPFLLQHGMEDRVAQLIRREKKHLKSVDEDEEVMKAKDVKNFQPELYCDICKTSVTCSEQMTMHLNGKRHLTKEKQHILKMMKTEGGDANEEWQEQPIKIEEKNEKSKEEEEPVKETAVEKDDYDWGNGGGSWDELKNDDIY